ncbi:hypothetical protein [Kiritimatiella glycovorans]|uniref:Toxin-antitoxin system, antitoxin component n=1 Tax=Kiritimatiella glycovorans TaxID=1307763 RepID=A0A0G3EDC5_9BACT|nr:hypothetical protein [Kiritimatiella glycovorans]AKJ64466.1 Toxin-antitoxin system, antitoxin component [Kiritimatiella glycovorans]
MKVKVGELKAHLSRYLRELEGQDEPLEVCVRERTVAYMVPAGGENEVKDERRRLHARLKQAGLILSEHPSDGDSDLNPPVTAGDGREDINTVQKMRGAKSW